LGPVVCTRERIERGWFSDLKNVIAIVALHDDRIVGHEQIMKFIHPQRKGSGDLVICLHQSFHNVRLGTAMLTELIKLGRSGGMHRIGLHVIADNKWAVHLYEKLGFTIGGTTKDSYFGENGEYNDELAMGLIL
jgi:ribosomal protein S18 acetylase RimI-like enzyme